MSSPAFFDGPAGLRGRRLIAGLPRWVRLLAVGASLWGLAVGVLLGTDDQYVVAAVVLGTFVVPLTLAVRFVDVERLPGVSTQLMLRLAACGGLLGFLASAFLERPIVSEPGPVFDSWVGVIEETSKLAILALMTRRLVTKTPRSGFVLGALVGLGFAAFESAGYALDSAVSSGGNAHTVIDMVLVRAAATPFTHGLWTAVAGAALFAASRNGRFRLAPLVPVALVAVAAIHACWDLMPTLATDLSSWLDGRPARGFGDLDLLLLDIGQGLISLPPLYVAYRLRRGRSRAGRDNRRAPSLPFAHPVPMIASIDRSAA